MDSDITTNIATVSQSFGKDENERRIIRVGDWQLSAWSDGDPRIRDIDLAEKLGFSRPRNIRKLIDGCIERGELSSVKTQEVVQRIEKTGAFSGTESRVIREYWLTEPEALFVSTRCEAPNAVALTWEMVNVYTLARRGLLPGQNNQGLTLSREEIAAIVKAEVETSLAPAIASVIEQAIAPVLALVRPIAEYPDRFPSRAELRDYPKECSECCTLIRRAAEASGVSWFAIHGRLLRHYQVRSYRRLPWPLWQSVRESLLQWIINPDPTTAPPMVIRQLPLFPQCA